LISWIRSLLGKPESLDFPTRLIRDLYEGHGSPVSVRDGAIYPTNGGPCLRARISNERELEKGGALRLDVLVELPDGRTIIECMAGWGGDRQVAIGQAFTTFTMGVFHVLLKAFHEPNDPHMEFETWEIDGIPRQVVVGDIVGRASTGGSTDVANKLMTEFIGQLKAMPLPPGTHWIRLYCAQLNNKVIAIEVLLDNDTWDEMQTKFAALPWPLVDGFYSARQFTVVQDIPAESPK
jgi:hypothetical protein